MYLLELHSLKTDTHTHTYNTSHRYIQCYARVHTTLLGFHTSMHVRPPQYSLCMYIRTYIYTSVSVCTYVYMSISVCTYVRTSVSVCTYVYMSVSVCTYVCQRMKVCGAFSSYIPKLLANACLAYTLCTHAPAL